MILLNKKRALTLISLTLLAIKVQAQLTLSGEFRPRAQYRHGYLKLADANQDPAFFINQRVRFNVDFKSNKYRFYLVFQDVRTWGSQPQLVTSDGSLTTLHEAWGELFFSDKISTKLGRQEIVYDDHRIMGNVNWLQQARSHDAIITKYQNNDFNMDIGFAYNQDKAQLTTNYYTVSGYKSLQFLRASKKFGALGASVIFMNTGYQGGSPADAHVNNLQTIGAHLTYDINDAIKLNGNLYKQIGSITDGAANKSALLYSLDLSYFLEKRHQFTVYYEYISGNDELKIGKNDKAFFPQFGTNHKFNGLMDYFYIAGHFGSVGLKDFNVKYKGAISDRLTAKAEVHFFSSDGIVVNPVTTTSMNKGLGTEIDLVSSIKLMDDVKLDIGYSQMFATETMEVLKGGSKDENNNWAWIMLTLKPVFYKLDQKKP